MGESDLYRAITIALCGLDDIDAIEPSLAMTEYAAWLDGRRAAHVPALKEAQERYLADIGFPSVTIEYEDT